MGIVIPKQIKFKPAFPLRTSGGQTHDTLYAGLGTTDLFRNSDRLDTRIWTSSGDVQVKNGVCTLTNDGSSAKMTMRKGLSGSWTWVARMKFSRTGVGSKSIDFGTESPSGSDPTGWDSNGDETDFDSKPNQDFTETIPDDQWITFKFEMISSSQLKFYIDNVLIGTENPGSTIFNQENRPFFEARNVSSEKVLIEVLSIKFSG